ncbi:MAG: NAD(P)/FAD-dependent oxidoreductase [Ilumatobacteraceae bacterium]
MSPSRVVVIGAGLAGLSAGRLLADQHEVLVLDKGRGVGGRMATRRIGEATLDHGAQFLTTHTDEFAAVVSGWGDAGLVQPWFHGQVGPTGVADPDGHPRYRGTPTMNAIARSLADGLDVRTSAAVRSVRLDGDGWVVSTETEQFRADAVLLTAPVPQSLALLDAGGVPLDHGDAEALQRIAYAPCIAVLAVLDGPSGLPEPGAVRRTDGPIDWMADNQRKGTSAVPAVTVHTSAAFSRLHWDDPDDAIVEQVMTAAGLASRPLAGLVQVHRWRFAKPEVGHPSRSLLARGVPPLAFAGDAFAGAAAEGAVLSGTDAAHRLFTQL